MNNKIRFNKTAHIWEEALPLGNGSMGAMVHGGHFLEKISMNLDTFWSGGPQDYRAENMTDVIKRMQELVLDRRYDEADKLAETEFSTDKLAQNGRSAGYLPAGDILIKKIDSPDFKETEFMLDMEKAEVSEEYTYTYRDSRLYKHRRRTFVSYPHKVMVVKVYSDIATSYSIFYSNDLEYDAVADGDSLCVNCKAPRSIGVLNKTYENSIPDKTIEYG